MESVFVGDVLGNLIDVGWLAEDAVEEIAELLENVGHFCRFVCFVGVFSYNSFALLFLPEDVAVHLRRFYVISLSSFS